MSQGGLSGSRDHITDVKADQWALVSKGRSLLKFPFFAPEGLRQGPLEGGGWLEKTHLRPGSQHLRLRQMERQRTAFPPLVGKAVRVDTQRARPQGYGVGVWGKPR